MTVFNGGDAITEFLEEFDSWLSESVTVYLLGGSAMTVHGLKDQTEDIDLALSVASEFEHVYQTLTSQGFTVVDEPTESFEGVGKTVELQHDERGLQIDLFERQVVGKVWITDRMHNRAAEFWAGNHATAVVLADEDMFLLKAVSGGDLASGRRRDIEDMRTYAQRGLDYEVILAEIDEQRPFNTGTTEAQQIRDRSHPLFTIEMAVNALSGLPNTFTARITEFQPNSRLNTPFWERSTMASTTSTQSGSESSRMCGHCRTTKKTPSTTRLADWSTSRFLSVTERRFVPGEQALRRWLLVPVPRGVRDDTTVPGYR